MGGAEGGVLKNAYLILCLQRRYKNVSVFSYWIYYAALCFWWIYIKQRKKKTTKIDLGARTKRGKVKDPTTDNHLETSNHTKTCWRWVLQADQIRFFPWGVMDDLGGKESCLSATSTASTRSKRYPKKRLDSLDNHKTKKSTDERDSKFFHVILPSCQLPLPS